MAAGRGRGRGRGLSFNVDLLQLESLPTPTLQPPPTYPHLEFKPVPLISGSETDYLVALKEELVQAFRSSEFFLEKPSEKKDIERYSDKFRQAVSGRVANFDFTYFPKELLFKTRRKIIKAKPNIKPKQKIATTQNKIEEISKKLEDLEAVEKMESDDENKDESKKNLEEENEEQEEEFEDDEDLLEEETDYASNYFDNGENYLDEEDDNLDDGPTY